MDIWESIWISQEKKCYGCGREVPLKSTAKSSLSLKIVCLECYRKPTKIIIDEVAIPKEE